MSWRRFLHREHWQQERRHELDVYLEAETADNIARGMSPREALAAAQRKLGNSTRVLEEIYRMNSFDRVEAFWQDVRHAWRLLFKNPGFTAVAVLSLALGIGANTAVFTVVEAVLLRPLPYPQPERLLRVLETASQNDVTMPELEFWKENAKSFEAISGERGIADQELLLGREYKSIRSMTITSDFFRTLAVAPALGREFTKNETHTNGPRAVILTDRLWREQFKADMNIVGRAITLDNKSVTVVGMLPRSFWFPQEADVFVPLQPNGSLGDTGTNTGMLARLRAGVTRQQADAEMKMLTESYRRAHPENISSFYRGLAIMPYQQWLAGDVRLNLLLLFGAVALLLLIACSNLASLLLSRLVARQREIAVRLAIGSSAIRLLQQFLVENIMLSMAGCLAGLLLATWWLQALLALIPFNLPASSPIRLNWIALTFSAAVALTVGAFFSLLPFLSSWRLPLFDTLKSATRAVGASAVSQRVRAAFVVCEIAFSMMLLAAAGLLIQSLYNLRQEHLGFEPQGLITFEVNIPKERRATAAGLRAFEATLLEQLHSVPGVDSVAGVNTLPFSGPNNLPSQRQNHPEQSFGGTEVRLVTSDYFNAMKIPLLRGRSINDRDADTAAPVAVLNETLARRWWTGGNAVGDRVVVGQFEGASYLDGKEPPRQIVGVVGDTKTLQLKEPARPTIYIPVAQTSDSLAHFGDSISWILRTAAPEHLEATLRRVVTGIDPRAHIPQVRTMQERVAKTTAGSRFDAWLFGSFAALALVLTAVGLYGLLSFSVAQRTAEIGTRIALGASRADIFKLILKGGMSLTAAGLVIGMAGAFAVAGLLSSLLFGVHPRDPLVLLSVSASLLAVGFVASYLPARRAVKVDATVALRYE